MKNKLQPKINKYAFAVFDSLLEAVTRRHGELKIEAQITPIDNKRTGIIFSDGEKHLEAFTVNSQGKVRQATIKA